MDTFHIVDNAVNANVLPCRWIFKRNGNHMNKSRLVPIGGNDYME